MDTGALKTLYSNLIAGRLPVGSGSAVNVVSNHAYAILGTNRLHAVVYSKAGYVYFFAVESRWMGSGLNVDIPFVDCLPGKPHHQGDGVYLQQLGDWAAALIIESGNVQFLCNEAEVLEDHLLGLDLPVFNITHTTGEPLRSIPQAILGVTDRISAWIHKVSLATLAVSALVFVGVHAYGLLSSTWNTQHLNVRAVENDLNATLEKISIQQPLAMQLSRLQQVTATVVRSGGWIEKYTIKGDKSEQFEIVLPSWVSQDYLDQLGRDVTTDLRDMDGLLIVRKHQQGKKP
ncbi:MAG TPA: hypothetical protein VGE55_02105 [Limnobacter sp.]|uniref:hypothetical protein n=1 Tax=Limnobacter sp. TaxID=2003368 RepID=UPI002ED9CB86